VKPGDLVRFEMYGPLTFVPGDYPGQHIFSVLGLCISYDKRTLFVKILHKGKIIKKHCSGVEKAGRRDNELLKTPTRAKQMRACYNKIVNNTTKGEKMMKIEELL